MTDWQIHGRICAFYNKMKENRRYAPNGVNYMENGLVDEYDDFFEHIREKPTAFECSFEEDDDLCGADLQGLGIIASSHRVGPEKVLVQIIKTKDAISGMIVREGDEFVFIERPPEADTPGIMKFGEILKKSKVDISDGVLRLTVAGVRHRCSAIGVLEPDHKVERGNMELPKHFRRPKVQTLASKDDSFGKSKWRAELVEMAQRVFPDGVEAIPEKDRKVLCFPGLGQEADMWIEFGFKEEDLVFVERDLDNVKKLQVKYPKAKIMVLDFKNHAQLYGQLKYIMDKDCRFSVVSVDPESHLSKNFQKSISEVIHFSADKLMVGINFHGKREQAPVIKFYGSLLEPEEFCRLTGKTSSMQPLKSEDLNDYIRLAAVERCVASLLARQRNFSIEATTSGSYQGASNSPMFYSMHHIIKIKK